MFSLPKVARVQKARTGKSEIDQSRPQDMSGGKKPKGSPIRQVLPRTKNSPDEKEK